MESRQRKARKVKNPHAIRRLLRGVRAQNSVWPNDAGKKEPDVEKERCLLISSSSLSSSSSSSSSSSKPLQSIHRPSVVLIAGTLSSSSSSHSCSYDVSSKISHSDDIDKEEEIIVGVSVDPFTPMDEATAATNILIGDGDDGVSASQESNSYSSDSTPSTMNTTATTSVITTATNAAKSNSTTVSDSSDADRIKPRLDVGFHERALETDGTRRESSGENIITTSTTTTAAAAATTTASGSRVRDSSATTCDTATTGSIPTHSVSSNSRNELGCESVFVVGEPGLDINHDKRGDHDDGKIDIASTATTTTTAPATALSVVLTSPSPAKIAKTTSTKTSTTTRRKPELIPAAKERDLLLEAEEELSSGDPNRSSDDVVIAACVPLSANSLQKRKQRQHHRRRYSFDSVACVSDSCLPSLSSTSVQQQQQQQQQQQYFDGDRDVTQEEHRLYDQYDRQQDEDPRFRWVVPPASSSLSLRGLSPLSSSEAAVTRAASLVGKRVEASKVELGASSLSFHQEEEKDRQKHRLPPRPLSPHSPTPFVIKMEPEWEQCDESSDRELKEEEIMKDTESESKKERDLDDVNASRGVDRTNYSVFPSMTLVSGYTRTSVMVPTTLMIKTLMPEEKDNEEEEEKKEAVLLKAGISASPGGISKAAEKNGFFFGTESSENAKNISTGKTNSINMYKRGRNHNRGNINSSSSSSNNKNSSSNTQQNSSDGTPTNHSRRFPCGDCNASFAFHGDLKRHRRIHTGERPFVCDQCEASFNRPDHLKYHMSRHSGSKADAKRFICGQCQRGFTRKFDLKRHSLRVHASPNTPASSSASSASSSNDKTLGSGAGVNDCAEDGLGQGRGEGESRSSEAREHCPFICCECDGRFATMSELKKHKRVQHHQHITNSQQARSVTSAAGERERKGDKPYSCQLCCATFIQASHLKSHMTKHADGRAKPDAHQFTQSTSLSALAEGGAFEDITTTKASYNSYHHHHQHYRYACTDCQARFAYPSNLKRHRRIHTGERPFVCAQCDANFSRPDHLKYHLGLHAGVKRLRQNRRVVWEDYSNGNGEDLL